MGLATAKAFAAAGAAVALVDVNEDAVKAAADGLIADGHRVIGIRCDVTNMGEVEAMVADDHHLRRSPGASPISNSSTPVR